MSSYDRDVFLSGILAMTVVIGGMLFLDSWSKWNDTCAKDHATRNDIECFIKRIQ
jgi:hypothetical protein